MKLTQLAAKPQLVKIEINDEDIIKEFGESLEFHIWDRQPMDKFIRLAQMKGEDMSELIAAVNDMVLDEEGNPVVKDGLVLPTNVMTRVIGKVVETLGK
jgi:phosphoribulokinase